MSETPHSQNEHEPEHMSALDAVGMVKVHVVYKLEQLHDLCQRHGFGQEVEDTLRANLLEELAEIEKLPQDLTWEQALKLGDSHYAHSDERDRIIFKDKN